MKGTVTKIFKLDEPLGRAGFLAVYVFMILFFVFMAKFIDPYNRFVPLIFAGVFYLVVSPIAVARRLVDIGRKRTFALIILIYQLVYYSVFILYGIKRKSGLSDLGVDDPIFILLLVLTFLGTGLFFYFLSLFLAEGNLAKKNYKKRDYLKFWVNILRVSVVLGFFGYVIGSCQYEKYVDKKAAMTIVAAVDQFELENEKYPVCLDELVPNYMDKIPKTKKISFGVTDFWYDLYDDDGKEPRYCVGFIYMPVRHLSYCSDKREWIDWD